MRFRKISTSRNIRLSFLVFFGAILLLNIGIGLAYRGETYPKTFLAGKNIGGKPLSSLNKNDFLPASIKLQTKTTPAKEMAITSADLKPQIEWQQTEQDAKKSKSILPLLDVFRKHQLSLKVNFDDQITDQKINQADKNFSTASEDWKVVIKNDKVSIANGKNGQQVNKIELKKLIYQSLSTTGQDVIVPFKTVEPKFVEKELQPVVDQLNKKAKVSLKFSYNGQTTSASAADILSWYDIKGDKINLNTGELSGYISSIGSKYGIGVKNLTTINGAVSDTLAKEKALQSTLVAAPKATKRYTFCTATKGVDQSLIPGFASKITSTLNDPRGWSLNGQVSFSYVKSGCNFTVWLTKASLMPSFGAICDTQWSCTVRPNVVINYDRWRYASDAWNAKGGSLDNYRNMVINHETGHWLGFGHRFCGGAGQLAPVMQQQSISLQGCKFNPWPNSSEKNTLKAQLGL